MIFIILITITWSYSIQDFLNLTPYQIQGLSTETLQQYFQSGQVNGYIGSQELSDLIEKLADSFPQQVSLISYGNSYKGQKINTIKISATKTAKYQIAVIGMLHGSVDLISINYLIYILYYFAIQLSNQQQFITTLFADKTLWITPAINLDGLQFINAYYNQNNVIPNIYKNRNSQNQNSCSSLEIGVDLSRNFQYKFGINEIGSSSMQCNQQYRGPHAFSESETLAIDQQISFIHPNIIITLGGDSNYLIITDNKTQIYQDLLWNISKVYNFNMNDYESLYKTQINGDLCQNYIYTINKICFTMNIGQNILDNALNNYQNLMSDFLQYYSPSLKMELYKDFDCSHGKMICKILESNEKGYVMILQITNIGYNTFNDNIMMDIVLNQGGEKLYQIDSYQITMNPNNQNDTKLQTGIPIDEISTELVYRYNLNYNKKLNSNQSIYFIFLITQYGFSYNYINTVSTINLTYSLQNTLLNSFVFKSLQPSQLKSKKSNQELQQIFPNRAESYVLLICFAGISVCFFFAWIIRKFYLLLYHPRRMIEEQLSKSGGSDEKNLEHYHPQLESRLNTQIKFSQIAPFQSIRANDSPPLSKQSSNITQPDDKQNNNKDTSMHKLLPHINQDELDNLVHRALEIVQQDDDYNQQKMEEQNNYESNANQLVNTPNVQKNNEND